VVSVPAPSSTTHKSVVFGWMSAVSAFVIRRMLTLNFPPSIMRTVWSFFASMSFRYWASFSVGIAMDRSVGACSRMTVCPSPRPRPWPPCAPRCGPTTRNAPAEPTAIRATACLRMGLSSEVELGAEFYQACVENLRRLPEDAASGRRAERPVGAVVIHHGAAVEHIVEVGVGLDLPAADPEDFAGAQIELIDAIAELRVQ